MKAIFFIALIVLGSNCILRAQSPIVGASTGLHGRFQGSSDDLVVYEGGKTGWPYEIKAAYGDPFWQLGIKYSSFLIKPEYIYKDPSTKDERFKEKYSESYIGILARAPLPFYERRKDRICYIQLGIGKTFSSLQETIVNDHALSPNEFSNPISFDLGLGLLGGISSHLWCELEMNYRFGRHLMETQGSSTNIVADYAVHQIFFQLGLNYSFVTLNNIL